MPIRAQDKGVEDRMAARAEALYEQQRKDRAALKSAPSTTKPKPDPFAADADPYNRVKLLNNPSPRSTKASATATSPRGYTPGTASANRPRYRSTYPRTPSPWKNHRSNNLRICEPARIAHLPSSLSYKSKLLATFTAVDKEGAGMAPRLDIWQAIEAAFPADKHPAVSVKPTPR